MSQDSEKYLYFTIGLLKHSSTLEALWQDALKYHMIDQPGKLIALRLTEYYDMIAQGGLHAGAGLSITPLPKAHENGHSRESTSVANFAGTNGANPTSDEGIIAASPDAEQNADEAADYWSQL